VSTTLTRPRLRVGAGAAIAVAAAAVALFLAFDAGVEGPAAVPEALRAGAAFVLLCAVCGYAPARLLLPQSMLAHLGLFVLPFGLVSSGVVLTFLGFARVPFDVSLPLTLVLFAASAIAVHRRLGPAAPPEEDLERAGPVSRRLLLPLWIAALLAAVALLPMLRSGFATVVGQNGDTVQYVGVAELLQVAPPETSRVAEPLDRMPPVWRSKYPIYYPMAAITRISGLEAQEAFATISAGLFALTAIGFFAFAFYFLRAGPLASLAAMGLVPLGRWLLYLAIHPFYNQLWGVFLFSLTLVFGVHFLRRPGRRSALLVGLFFAMGAFAYPLMLPYPVLALGVAALVIRRQRLAAGQPIEWISALRLRRPRSLLAWIPLLVLGLPVALVLTFGVLEKSVGAAAVMWPGKSLLVWQGGDPYLELPAFFGVPGRGVPTALAVVAVVAIAVVGLLRRPREVAWPILAVGAAGLLLAAYFRARDYGELFYFRSLSFSTPFVLAAAVVTLAEGARLRSWLRWASAAGLALLAAGLIAGARTEIDNTYDQLTPDLLQLREFSDELPPGSSIRIDLRPDAHQFWARHWLHEHPLSVRSQPIGSVFPYPPLSRKADYILTKAGRDPADAVGAPVLENPSYAIYRMDPSVPGPDRTSRKLFDSYTGEGE
jgi:hypothetical protein